MEKLGDIIRAMMESGKYPYMNKKKPQQQLQLLNLTINIYNPSVKKASRYVKN